jgi:serine/threonine protein phosphatase 1
MQDNTKRRRFCLGDVHGAYNALVQVLERCAFDYENDLLITIGDIVDGWGDSFKCVEHLLTIPNRIDIIGNHDAWFLTFIDTGIHETAWKMGGLSTATSYANAAGIDFKVTEGAEGWITNLNSGDIPEEHKKFFKGQHKYYKDQDNNLFVHGGFNPYSPIGKQLAYTLMWDRHLWSKHLAIKGGYSKRIKYVEVFNKIFIGHTSTTSSGSYKPVKIDKLINMDTGAGDGGYLSIMDIDSGEFWQSDYVPDLYPDDPHHHDNF